MDEPRANPIGETPEYELVSAFYAGRRAQRSGVPYMQHIDQGLEILEGLGASDAAMRAFALHPLVQADDDLSANLSTLSSASGLNARSLILALEYRSVANAFLSFMEEHPGYDDPQQIRLSPLPEVNQMLVADKVQNYRDFLRFHRDTHPRSAFLERYFRAWLTRLDVPSTLIEAGVGE